MTQTPAAHVAARTQCALSIMNLLAVWDTLAPRNLIHTMCHAAKPGSPHRWDEALVREAMWWLISEQHVVLTHDRRLRRATST